MAMRWYIVHAYSNFEKKVAEAIEEKKGGKESDLWALGVVRLMTST